MVPRITKVFHSAVAALVCVAGANAGVDPVKDYLEMFSPLGGGPRFFSDDSLLQLEVDLDGDGQKEVLLSIARDRNGKQGNGWAVYKQEKGVFNNVGGITFSESKIFVGPIKEVRSHGLVSFWSSGRGEGSLLAYTIAGGKVTETKIGELEWDANSERMRGQAVFNKYFGEKQGEVVYEAQEIGASEFGPKYKLWIAPLTFSQFLSAPPSEQEAIESLAQQSKEKSETTGHGTPVSNSGEIKEVSSQAPESSALGSPTVFNVRRNLVISILLVGVLSVAHLALRARKVEDRS